MQKSLSKSGGEEKEDTRGGEGAAGATELPPREKKPFLGEFEELVLLAVARLGETAYGVPIWETLEKASGRSVALGSIYITLERLEKKGFVSSRLGDATAQRGGKAKRYFKIEAAGLAALQDMDHVRTSIRTGLLSGTATPKVRPC